MERYMTKRDYIVRETVNEMKYSEEEDHGDCEMDQLFLVHSDISFVLHQIDELVVKATKVKTMSKQGTREVESFRSVLSDMLSSLKPWFPRLQEAICDTHLLPKDQKEESLSSVCPSEEEEEELYDVESPEPTQFESLVSPSPLVSWRGDHNVEKGRQLFHLTPLPLGKSEFLKHQNASKMKSKKNFPNSAANQPLEASRETTSDEVLGDNSLGNLTDSSESLVECEPPPLSSPVLRKRIQSELLMTPCLKMSPLKSCTLFKPVLESSKPGKQGACKSTCSEFGASNFTGSQSSESSSGNDQTDDLCSKYPEILGMQHAPITRRTDFESSPIWSFSPPATCVLLNEKKSTDESRMVSSFAFPNIKPEAKHTKEGSMSMVVESTPLLKEAESVMTKNRTRAGESTLKRELWTRFEEASTRDNVFGSMTTTTVRENKKKGFMEMLEEVCGNEESQEC